MAKPSDDGFYAPPQEHPPVEPAESDAEREAARLAAAALEQAPGDESAPTVPPQRSFAVRAAVTLGAAGLVTWMDYVPMPGYDPGATGAPEWSGNPNISIAALGIMPVVSAYILIELAALAVPQWRKLRHGGPEARARLDRAAARLVLLLAFFQAYGVVQALRALGGLQGSPWLPEATLIATTFLLWAVAGAVSRHGLGNGVIWLLSVGALRFEITRFRNLAGGGGTPPMVGAGASVALMLAAVVLTGVATVLVLRPERAAAPKDGSPGAEPLRLRLPIPVSGTAPFFLAAALLGLPATLISQGTALPPGFPDRRLELAIAVLAAALWAVVLGYLLHRPARLRALLGRAGLALPPAAPSGGPARLVRLALPATLAYLLALLLAKDTGLGTGIGSIALLVAWGMDVAATARARRQHPTLVTIWRDERPHAAEILRAALARHGIFVHPAGLAQRTLLQFGAGYAPIEIQVPADQAARAKRHAAAVLPDPLPAESMPVETARRPRGKRGPGKKASAAPEPVLILPTAPPRRTVMVLGILAAVGFLLMTWTYSPPRLSSAPTAAELAARSTLLQLVLIDDDTDVLAAPELATTAPGFVRFQTESLPVAAESYKNRSRTYAVAVAPEGQSADAVLAKMRSWLDGIAVPPGTRFALAEEREWDPDTDSASLIGWRTYLLRGDPFLTGADVRVARAQVDSQTGSHWQVLVELSEAAGETFRKVTRDNVKRRIAVVLRGMVTSAPMIQSEISGGRVSITMGAGDPAQKQKEAEQLARDLDGG